MTNLRNFLWWSLVSFTLASCGWTFASIDKEFSTPAWFPQEFYYSTVGNCEDGNLGFRVLIGAGTQLWTDPQAVLVGQTEIYLRKDGTYSARYREFNFAGQALFIKNFESTFSFDNQNQAILLKDLGVGTIQTTERGRKYLHLQYSENFNSPQLKGNTGEFFVFENLIGLNTDRGDYCGF